MRIDITVRVLTLIAVNVLVGCSFSNEKYLNVDYSKQSERVKVPIDAHKSLGSQTNDRAGIYTLKKYTVYFLHDSNEVDSSFIPLIEKQSQDLLDNPDVTLVLEGHADERGSREYNIALGEERAKTVSKMIQAHGVRANQIEIVSYGEENPSSAQSESAWHLNQRVNLISQRTQK